MKTPALLAMSLIFAASLHSAPVANKQESHYAQLGTNKVHYLTVGQGNKTLVFVHGWAGNADFWREQVPDFQGKAKLILIDLPGHGRSDKPHVDYTMDFFGEAVNAVVAHAKASKPTLIGHSMGVAVICRAYSQQPNNVAALVAVDGLLRRPDIPPDRVQQFIGPYSTSEYRQHTTNFISSMFTNAGTAALRDRVIADVLKTPQHVMAGAMQGMFGAGQPNWHPQKVSVPVLVINAPNPMWTPEYEAYVKALSPVTEYRVMEKVGHCLMLEKPKEFNALLLELLEKHNLID
jgi:pimeloyl-ACP methyl ester carboxylesterase